MLNDYIEHLRQVNKKLQREGIVLPIDLDVDNQHIYSQVTILEHFLYFNSVLKKSDSLHNILDILNFKESTLTDFLRSKIYEDYEEEWNRKLAELTEQPKDAGNYGKPIEVISNMEIKLFTEALGLDNNVDTSEIKSPESLSFPWGTGSTSFAFEDEDEEDDDE